MLTVTKQYFFTLTWPLNGLQQEARPIQTPHEVLYIVLRVVTCSNLIQIDANLMLTHYMLILFLTLPLCKSFFFLHYQLCKSFCKSFLFWVMVGVLFGLLVKLGVLSKQSFLVTSGNHLKIWSLLSLSLARRTYH